MTPSERLQLADRIPKDSKTIEIISYVIGAPGVVINHTDVKIEALSLVIKMEARGLIDELVAVLDWLEADCERVTE